MDPVFANQELEQQIDTLKQEIETLRSEALKYRTLFNCFPLGITVSDSNGRIIESNATAEKLLGVIKEEHEKRTINGHEWRIVRIDGSEMPSDEWASVVALKEKRLVSHCEMGITKPNGQVTWIDVTAAPLPGEGSGVVITYNDITEKIETRKKQIENENKFRLFFENAGFYGYMVSPDGLILEVNNTAASALGHTRDEIIGRPVSELYAANSRSRAQRAFQQWKANGRISNVELVVRAKDGTERVVLLNADTLTDGSGAMVSSAFIHIDITDRKRLETQLEQYKNIVSSTADGIAFLDMDYRYVMVNQAYEKFSGVGRDRFIGLTVLEYLGKDVFENFIKPNFDRCMSGETINYQEWFEYPTIGRRYVDVTYYPYRSDSGRISGVIANTRDITGQKLAEEALRENENHLRQSEKQYRFLMESITDSVYVLDAQWRHILVNQAASDITRLPREQLIGSKLTDLFPSVEDTVFFKTFQKVMHHRTPESVVGEYSFGDGRKDWYEVFVYPVPQGILCISRDITERKNLEMKLAESELLHRSTIANISDAVIITDDEGNFTYICPNTSKIFGFSSEKLFAQGNISCLFEHRFFENEALISKNELLNLEVNFINQAGNHLTLLVDIKRVSIGKGTILYTCKDATEIVQFRKALAESENTLKATLDGLSTHIALLDKNGEIITVNRAWRLFAENNGIAADLVSEGINYLRVCDEAGGECAEESIIASNGIREVLSGAKEAFSFEYPCHSPDEKRWFVAHVCSVPGAGKKRVVIAHHNITDRKLSEIAVKESEGKYRSIMEAMDELTYICSSEFEIKYMNPAMMKWLGRSAIGEICYQALHGLDTQCSWCVHEKVMEGETVRTELVKPGSDKAFLVSNTPIFHSNGSVSKLSLYRDITEIKKLEKQIQQAQKMESIGNLAGGIAHDFNNILFPIIGMSELLMDDLPQNSPEWENVREIFKAGRRGSELVKQILAFSRQSEHKMIPTRVQSILKEVLKLLRSTIPSNIEMSQHIQPDCGLIQADPTQIHQVAMNIITNAYHAMEETGGRMHVRLEEIYLEQSARLDSGTYAVLSVSDTGHGIPAEMIDKIFDPYFTTKAPGKGTGLGLAAVHGIVKQHKGDVAVYSEVGQGSTFTVYLPVLKELKTDNPTPADKALHSGTERILLVDDEAAIVKLLKMMLERFGYDVTTRTSSYDALEAFKFRPSHYDLVISDMTMPNMTGIQLAQELKKTRPDIPIIVCTGFSERINEKKAETIGIEGFIKKPVIKSDLSKLVRNVLDESRAKKKRSQESQT